MLVQATITVCDCSTEIPLIMSEIYWHISLGFNLLRYGVNPGNPHCTFSMLQHNYTFWKCMYACMQFKKSVFYLTSLLLGWQVLEALNRQHTLLLVAVGRSTLWLFYMAPSLASWRCNTAQTVAWAAIQLSLTQEWDITLWMPIKMGV